MQIKIKGNKLILSEAPKKNVYGAFIIKRNKRSQDDTNTLIFADANEGQKEYELPEGLTKNEILGLYLRVL